MASPSVVIAGGGVAGVEAALALAELAEGLATVTLVSPQYDFVVRPFTVEEPFTSTPAERHPLRPTLAEIDVAYVHASVRAVDIEAHRVDLGNGSALEYDFLIVCVGGRARPAYRSAETFWSDRTDIDFNRLIEVADRSFRRTLAFVVPPAPTWPLPLYELALLTRRRAAELGRERLRIRLLTSEPEPLIVFGRSASEAVKALFAERAISLQASTHVVEDSSGALHVAPRGQPLSAAPVVSLPIIEGNAIEGLPTDPSGFLPIDGHCRVAGAEDVYAAGDIANFPIKQGGLATQQADAACEDVAARLGAAMHAAEFKPQLAGQLVTGGEPLRLNAGAQKLAGRYLSGWLQRTPDSARPED
jgi:sulfide:quinone oxidoreductase